MTRLNVIVSTVLLVFTFPALSHGDQIANEKLSTAANCFTLNFYKLLAKEEGSKVCSPFSLDVLLSILRVGSGGKTLQELTTALGYDTLSVQLMQETFRSQLGRLTSSGGNTLEVANSIWLQNGFQVKETFKNAVASNFYAKVDNVDFAGNPSGAKAKINSWGNDKTRGLIPSLFDQDLDRSTIMVLVNAIYLKGEWQTKFNKDATKDGDFYNKDSKTNPSKVKLMHLRSNFKYSLDNTLNAQVLEMDYSGGNMSMLILLPQSGSNMADLQSRLTCDSFKSAVTSGRKSVVDVTLPKFEITSSFDLVDPIKKAGMPDMFNPGADFSGIAPGIAVSKAIQKAVIKVYEEGSEAAALTAISVVKTASVNRPPPDIEYFRADHPFIFMIREKSTNLILFMGRVSSLPNTS